MKTRRTRTMKEVFAEYNGTDITMTDNSLLPTNFKSLPYKEQIQIYQQKRYAVEKKRIFKCDENRIYFSIKSNVLKRAGNRIFKKIDTDQYIIIKSKSITSCFIKDSKFIYDFYLMLSDIKGQYQWLIKNENGFWNDYSYILMSKPIIRGILTGKIHSEETLVKSYMKICSFPETINWKDFKKIYTSNCLGSDNTIYDLRDFTVSPAATFRRIANEGATRIMLDCLEQAAMTGEKINFYWSDRRFSEEHDRMTEKIMLKEITKKTSENIFDKTVNEPESGIRQLNTEKEVFKEGMLMHHCIYTNYWDRISNRKYLAFHMLKEDGTEEENDGCTFAIGLDHLYKENTFYFQIYQKRNKRATETQRQKMLRFAETHKELLLAQLKSNSKSKKTTNHPIEEDMPF